MGKIFNYYIYKHQQSDVGQKGLTMLITKTSPFSGDTNVMDIDVTEEQIALWESGVPIQNAMPNVSADEREFIMTGITPEEWDSAFK